MRLISYRDGAAGESLGVVAGDRWAPASLSCPPDPRRWPSCSPAASPRSRRCGRPRRQPGSRMRADRSMTSSSSHRSPVPARSSPSVATIATTSTRRAPRRQRRPSSSASGRARSSVTGAEIRWDPALTAQVDYEAELAVVIGRTARRVSEAEALDHVLGYTCLDDVSARDLQFGDGQWARGKSLDTFCPMGPVLVTADEIARPAGPRHHVPGQRRGPSSRPTRPDVLRRRGDHQPLLAVVHASSPATSSPPARPAASGSSATRRSCSTDGDVVAVEIEGIGRLVNTCRFERVAVGERMSERGRSGSSSRARWAASAPGPSAPSSARARR